MKNKIPFVLLIIAFTFMFTNCRDKAKEAETKDAETISVAKASSEAYTALPNESTITWSGYKPTGSHTGTIALSSGEFTVNDGKIESGTFTIDMASLKDSEGSAKLEKHLKSADFFEVETYPNATFEVTGFDTANEKTMLSGNLTLKGTTNNVSFPVTVTNEADLITLTSETFTIDRSKWNVKFKSKSFFNDLGEKYINDDIELTIVVKGKKQ